MCVKFRQIFSQKICRSSDFKKSWFDDRHPDRQTPVTYDTDFELVDSEEFFLIGQLFKSLISINIEQSKATYDEIVV